MANPFPGLEAVIPVITDLLALTRPVVPEQAIRNEIELLVVRLLRLARRKNGDAANQIALCVGILKYLNADKYATLDEASAPGWVLTLRPEAFADATAAVDLVGDSRARYLLFQIGSIVARADGFVSWEEQQVLRSVRGNAPWKQVPGSDTATPSEPLPELLGQLQQFVGLESVKADIHELVDYIRLQQMRRSERLKTADLSLHMVFAGNPGTGKTTVARLVARIYRALGVLGGGHMIETDRAGLVAGYVGQTALKVDEVVARATGGVLFIDEAYSLARPGDGQDFGREAIETLVKRMEDRRSQFAVIAAGYPREMQAFLDSNPGLASRFSRTLVFSDYSPPELLQIFKKMCRDEEYLLSRDAESRVAAMFTDAYQSRDSRFGNARFARNVFEHAIRTLATRVVALPRTDRQMLMTIEAEDFEHVHVT